MYYYHDHSIQHFLTTADIYTGKYKWCIKHGTYLRTCIQRIPAELPNEILGPFANPFWEFNNINTLQNDVVSSHWISTTERRADISGCTCVDQKEKLNI